MVMEERNEDYERAESGHVGVGRRKPNGDAEIGGVPMSALTSPKTRCSGRTVRNGDVRTEMEGTEEEGKYVIEELIGETERWNHTRGNGMNVRKLELDNQRHFEASGRMLGELRTESRNSNMLKRKVYDGRRKPNEIRTCS